MVWRWKEHPNKNVSFILVIRRDVEKAQAGALGVQCWKQRCPDGIWKKASPRDAGAERAKLAKPMRATRCSATRMWTESFLFRGRHVSHAKGATCCGAREKQLSVCLSIHLSIYLSIYLSLSLFLSSVYLSSCLSIYPSIYLSICLSIHLSICLSVYLSIYLSVCLSICLSVYLSSHLSIYLIYPAGLSLSLFHLITYLSIYLPVYLSLPFICLSV